MTAGLLGIVVCAGVGAVARAESNVEDLRRALQDLNVWGGDSANARAWRHFLRTEELQAQLDRGAQADRAVVAEILGRFRSDVPGLTHARFARVARELAAWASGLKISSPEQLAAQALADKAAFRPLGADQLQRRAQQTRAALRELDAFLASSGEANRQAWKTYLQWDQIERQVQPGVDPDPAVLEAVGARYYAGAPGLELAPFVKVRDALRALHAVRLARDEAQLRQQYDAQLERLAGLLTDHAAAPTAEKSQAIGAALAWLEEMGQTPALAAAVRQTYSRPNLLVRVSERLVAAGIQDEVDDVAPVADTILGTKIQGTGRTVGQVSAYLTPTQDRAAVDILLAGTTTTNTIGRNGPVSIHSSGLTTVSGRKRLLIDTVGIQSQAATAECTTRTNIGSISAGSRMGSRMIERFAWRRASKQKPRAEWVAARHAEQRVTRRMDQRSQKLLSDANRAYLRDLKQPLERRGAFPARLNFSSTSDHLYLTALQAGPAQLAAPSAPPDLTGDTDLTVRLHESLVNNSAEAALAGMTLTDERLVQLLEDAKREVPAELQIGPEKDPWSITFAWQQPVTVVFHGDQVVVSVRGRRFSRGDQQLNKLMNISATYRLEKTPTGARLVRQGDVDVNYPGREDQRQGVREVAFKTFMRTKFDALFKPEIVGEGITLPGRWEKAGKLQLHELVAQNGWLSLGWQ